MSRNSHRKRKKRHPKRHSIFSTEGMSRALHRLRVDGGFNFGYGQFANPDAEPVPLSTPHRKKKRGRERKETCPTCDEPVKVGLGHRKRHARVCIQRFIDQLARIPIDTPPAEPQP